MPIEVGQHNLEIQANAEHWRRKPLLQRIYRDFYREIAGELRSDLRGETRRDRVGHRQSQGGGPGKRSRPTFFRTRGLIEWKMPTR